MPLLHRLRLGQRLALGFGTIVALVLTALALNLSHLAGVRAEAAESAGPQAERYNLAATWRENIAVNAWRAIAVATSDDEAFVKTVNEEVQASSASTTELVKRFEHLEGSREGQRLRAQMQERRKAYLAAREEMFKAKQAKDQAALRDSVAKFREVVKEYLAGADQLLALQDKRVKESAAATVADLDGARAVDIALVIAVCVLSLFTGLGVTRSVVAPVQQAEQVAQRIATGDLTTSLQVEGSDEAARLQQALRRMQDALREMITKISSVGNSVAAASIEVSSGSEDLRSRSERVASSLQETAAAVEQLSVTITQSSQAIARASDLAKSTSEAARKGGTVVSGVVKTMGEISDSSKRIGDIISVIDGIAFQTNILALNAAVEAARAGEQGRGFAVVAGEVRTLAGRSAEAAREIKSLIGQSMERVDAGMALVSDAGGSMEEVVGQVEQVTNLILEVSSAVREQAESICSVRQAVSEIDRSTKHNVQLVEQSASASRQLSCHAEDLASAVSAFRT